VKQLSSAHQAPAPARRLAAPSGVAFASIALGYAVALRPIIVVPLAGSAVLLGLVLAGTDVLIGTILLARHLTGGAVAESSIVGGFNAGALVGLLVIGVGAARVLVLKRTRGVLVTIVLSLLLLFWAGIGWATAASEYDLDVTRELVRSISVIFVALLVVNASDGRAIQRLPGVVVVTALVPALVALWQLSQGLGFEGSARVYGTLPHPNSAGGLFAVGLAVALWKFLEDRGGRRYLVAAALFGLALLGTQSMGAIGQAVVSVLVFAFLAYRRTPKMAALMLAGVILAAAFAVSPLGSGRVESLRGTGSLRAATDPGAIPSNSLEWRLNHWARQVETWEQKPVFGWGLAATSSFRLRDGFQTHSDPIRVLVETGAVGLFVFSAAFLLLLIRLHAAAGAECRRAPLPLAVLAILAGLAANSFANHVSEQTPLLYAVAVLVGCALWRDVPTRSPRST
jgi:O-antigen ligase